MVYEKLENPNVYLTFNDNNSDLTEKVLKVLREKEIKATFLESINTNNIKKIKEISDAGHTIAIYVNEKTNIPTFKSNFENLERNLVAIPLTLDDGLRLKKLFNKICKKALTN